VLPIVRALYLALPLWEHSGARIDQLDHKRRAQPNAYLGRNPSYDRAAFDRIRLALHSGSPPSLSAIAKVEGPVQAGAIQIKAGPAGRVEAAIFEPLPRPSPL